MSTSPTPPAAPIPPLATISIVIPAQAANAEEPARPEQRIVAQATAGLVLTTAALTTSLTSGPFLARTSVFGPAPLRLLLLGQAVAACLQRGEAMALQAAVEMFLEADARGGIEHVPTPPAAH